MKYREFYERVNGVVRITRLYTKDGVVFKKVIL